MGGHRRIGTAFMGPVPVRFTSEFSYSVAPTDTGIVPDWGVRFAMTPVMPAFVFRGR